MLANLRDDFLSTTKEILAKRVGFRCSNPNCRKLTCGPNDDPQKVTNIGVAAHIAAAAKGGPRYDERMTPDERKSLLNGIWLCQSCSTLVDRDESRYTVEVLNKWKSIAEDLAILELETNSPAKDTAEDIELIQFYVQCFDRPAFQDDICQEGRMEDFDQAIEDTIIALNTGILRTRDGAIIKQAEGKSLVRNPDWREKLDNISDMLVSIRRRLKIAKAEHAYTVRGTGGDVDYYFRDKEVEEWFNLTRREILKILSSMCQEIGIRGLHFPNRRYKWYM